MTKYDHYEPVNIFRKTDIKNASNVLIKFRDTAAAYNGMCNGFDLLCSNDAFSDNNENIQLSNMIAEKRHELIQLINENYMLISSLGFLFINGITIDNINDDVTVVK